MSHFARIENGTVVEVLVVEQDVIDSGALGDPSKWVQTSYNTALNEHVLGGTPLRGNFAGVGDIYDAVNDVFYRPQTFPSWTLNTTKWIWEAPTPYPTDVGTEEAPKYYDWNEATLSWVQLTL